LYAIAGRPRTRCAKASINCVLPRNTVRALQHATPDYADPRGLLPQRQRSRLAIEIYRDKPILYGCGDFLNDYAGISGQEAYRGDLALM
jgi:hypothetical protein